MSARQALKHLSYVSFLFLSYSFFFPLIFTITLFVWFWRIDLICNGPPEWNLCLSPLLLEHVLPKALLTTDQVVHTVGTQQSVNK